MSEIDNILELRKNHQLRAAEHKTYQEAAFEQAKRRVEGDKETLENFTRALPRLEGQLFDEVKGQQVSMSELDAMRNKVRQLHEREKALELRLEEGRKRLAAAQKTLDEAVERFKLALREVEKIKEAVRVLTIRQNLAAERVLEKENEEFYSIQKRVEGEL